MDVARIIQSVRRTFRNHGAWPAVCDVVIRAANKCMYYRNIHFFVVERVNPQTFELPSNFRFTRLQRDVLQTLAKQPECELRMDFVQRAIHKGDECYAIFDGDTLANYGWYSRKPTVLYPSDLTIHFAPQFVYMYKGFTLDRYRGLRLHAISKTRALSAYLERGLSGMLSCVESNNFNSLKSTYRMGAHDCGRIRVARIMGRYVIRADGQCKKYGLALHHSSANPVIASSLGKLTPLS
jgi:hypothetical protein